MEQSIKVMKFGGTSVGNASCMRSVMDIIINEQSPNIVVISAMEGITNLLLQSAHYAAGGQTEDALLASRQILHRYNETIDQLIHDFQTKRTMKELAQSSIKEFVTICKSIAILGEHTSRILDVIVSRGERFSARLIYHALLEKGHKVTFVDSTEFLFLKKSGRQILPNLEKCKIKASEVLHPLHREFYTIITTGYIACGPEGRVTTLGRGGSDYSASLISQCYPAKELILYKEVEGLLTADPTKVTSARIVPQLHYREAAELAYFGAKILHPRCIIPLVKAKIPVTIKNTFNQDFPGTLIDAEENNHSMPVKALTSISEQVLFSVEGKGMLGVPGIAGRTFNTLAKENISVSFISQSSSESNICFVVPQEQKSEAKSLLINEFHWELKNCLIDRINTTSHLSIIALVGLGMKGTPGIAARTFSALAKKNINITAIAQGSSELNISFAVADENVKEALNLLHDEFMLNQLEPRPSLQQTPVNLHLYGFGQIGQTLLKQLLNQKEYFEHSLSLAISIKSVFDRSGGLLFEDEFVEKDFIRLTELKKSGTKIDEMDFLHTKPLKNIYALQEKGFLNQDKGGIDIFVDNTDFDEVKPIKWALNNGMNCVMSNKKPLAYSWQEFKKLQHIADTHKLKIRYEATVGAGLPIIDTLHKLSDTGDEIISIQGCLSGSLGWILSKMEEGYAFSEALEGAHKHGYTEPNPLEDISGNDVARKALILARYLGNPISWEDVKLEPLCKIDLSFKDVEQLLIYAKNFNQDFERQFKEAIEKQCTLRYIASITKDHVSVQLQEVPLESAFGRLKGTSNQVEIVTKRYQHNHLIVSGPGAGAEVTAAGVLNDIIHIFHAV